MRKFIIRLTIVIIVISLLVSIFAVTALAYARKFIDYDTDEDLFRSAKLEQTIYYYAYDRTGELKEVYKSSENSVREWADFEDIGENLKKGFIAVEDREFYRHSGVNFKRTAAAVLNHLFKFKESFGASTITQQVIKNISGDNENTVFRKLKEVLRAFNLEKYHSKDDIFELYLNIVPMSGNIYGVGAASEVYFNKEPSELTLSEAATIIGITNAPTRYNPYTNTEACIEKRNNVLYAMKDFGSITETEYEYAVAEPLKLSDSRGNFGVSSWFIETANEDILRDISDKYSLSRSGARLMLNGSKIILTLNPSIQRILEEYFYDEKNLSEKILDGLNYSMVVSDPFSGDLLGIIGNGGKKRGERLFNYATTPIIPGSVLKPIALYAPLIEKNEIHWSTMLEDTPVSYIDNSGEEIGYPKNTPDIYEGMIDINDALKKSKNTIAVRLYNILGGEQIFNFLENVYSFDTLVRAEKIENGAVISDINTAPLALGQLSYGVSLRKLTEAYNPFPAEGVLYKGRSYTKVYDRNGKTLLNNNCESKRIYSIDTSQLMNQLLSNVVIDGTARQITLKDSVDTAGKTGTSGNDLDRLFIGYTPYYTAGIWCGFGNSSQEVGQNNPSHLQIWDTVMKRIHEELIFCGYEESERGFNTSALFLAPYCSISGQRPSPYCELDDAVTVKFGYYRETDMNELECDRH